MADVSVTLDGEAKLRKLLTELENGTIINDGLKVAAERLRLLSQGRTPRYDPQKGEKLKETPGTTKKSWSQIRNESSKLWSFFNYQGHAAVLEDGTYPERMVVGLRADGSPGRLTNVGGGVYSIRAQGGIVSPLLEDASVINRLLGLVALEIKKQMQALTK